MPSGPGPIGSKGLAASGMAARKSICMESWASLRLLGDDGLMFNHWVGLYRIIVECSIFDVRVRVTAMFRVPLIVWMIFICARTMLAGPSGSVRVYAVEPASFDYVFTAIVSSSATNPVLSFNHRAGRTYFVRPGERLGDYRVTDFQPVTTRIFNPTINMNQERKGGRVTLSSTNQPGIVLELGKRVPQPGWMAYLVNLADGNWWSVKESDAVMMGSATLVIGPVGSNSVTLYVAGLTNQAPLITDSEAKQLAALWESRARSRTMEKEEEAIATAREPDDSWIEEVKASAPRPVTRPQARTVVMQYPSRTFFGGYVPCPVDYLILPGIWSTSGQMIRPTMVVPRRFETRSAGIAIEYH